MGAHSISNTDQKLNKVLRMEHRNMENGRTMNTITLNDVLPYVSVLIAALAFMRNSKSDSKADIVSITTVTNKLDNISDGIREIKTDMKEQKTEILALRDRVIELESACKSAHKRIDTLEGKK